MTPGAASPRPFSQSALTHGCFVEKNQWAESSHHSFKSERKKKRKKRKSKGMPRWVCILLRLREDGVAVLGQKSLLDPGRLGCQNITLRRHKLTRAGTDTHPGSMWPRTHIVRGDVPPLRPGMWVFLWKLAKREGAVWDIYTACEGMWQDSPSPRSKRSPTLSFNGNAS